jgi:phage gp36-like protein
MAYATTDDILMQLPEDTLIDLTDDEGLGVVVDNVVTRAVEDADEEIDGFLAVRYALPFSTTPRLVRKFSVDIAICNLYARKPGTTPDERKENCQRAREMLGKIAEGKLNLDVPEPNSDADYGVQVTTDKTDRIFSMGRTSDSSAGTLDNF